MRKLIFAIPPILMYLLRRSRGLLRTVSCHKPLCCSEVEAVSRLRGAEIARWRTAVWTKTRRYAGTRLAALPKRNRKIHGHTNHLQRRSYSVAIRLNTKESLCHFIITGRCDILQWPGTIRFVDHFRLLLPRFTFVSTL